MTVTSRSAPNAKTKRVTKIKSRTNYWSSRVTQRSDAVDLERRAFTWRDPKRIARSLKRSAERSKRRKAGPYQSAMSMLNFYLNRGGRNLSTTRRKGLPQARLEAHLRSRPIFGVKCAIASPGR